MATKFICEHGNEVEPELVKAFCRMPDSFYRRATAKLDPDIYLFTSEHAALSEQALTLAKTAKYRRIG